MRWLPVLATVSFTLVLSSDGLARCSESRDLIAFSNSAAAAIRCAEMGEGLRVSHGHSCHPRPPPACSGDAVERIVDLVYGAAPEMGAGRHTAAARCQRAISRGAAQYVKMRAQQRRRGIRRAPRSRFLGRLEHGCEDVDWEMVSHGRFPSTAGRCGVLAAPGAPVDERQLARCIIASLEAIVDDVAPSPLRPNIVIILTDDQRWDTLDSMPLTLDRLADQGMRFSQAIVNTPVCGPSRANILTGRYTHNHGVLVNRHPSLQTSFDHDGTVGRWLSDTGYRTAFLGKYINGAEALGTSVPAGWDEWQVFQFADYFNYELNVNGTLVSFGSEPESYSTDYLADQALEFIEANRDDPFLLIYSVAAPHLPATPAARHAGLFADIPLWRPPNFRGSLLGKPRWLFWIRSLYRGVPAGRNEGRIRQLESLQAVDDAVEEISELLDDLGLTDNTMVIFLSDNGLHWGEHWWTSKFTGYEESVRIPLVIRYPVHSPVAQESGALVSNVDIAPTLAELAGIPVPEGVDGRSLLPLMEGDSNGRDLAFFEVFDNFIVKPSLGVRNARWKYILTYQPSVFEELYDLESDPYELINLASDPDYGQVKAALAARLSELRAQ